MLKTQSPKNIFFYNIIFVDELLYKINFVKNANNNNKKTFVITL